MFSLLPCRPSITHSPSFARTLNERCVTSSPFSNVSLAAYLIFPKGERNYIMQVVCEATQNPSVQVQAMAFECLVRIMTLYYSKMAYYMERALFGVDHLRHFVRPIS